MQRRPAAARRVGIELAALLRVGLRQRIEAGGEGAVVEHRAANQQRRFPPLENLADSADRVGAPAPGGVALIRIDDVDQVMRYALALYRARLGGADVHAPVNLRRIERDDLQGYLFRKRESERRLAARRGPQKRVSRARQRPPDTSTIAPVM